MTGLKRPNAGFTLVEVIAVAVILAILIAVFAPVALKISAGRKVKATRDEVEQIYKAVMGRNDGANFGFVGDVGRLPSALSELVDAATFPSTRWRPRARWAWAGTGPM